MTRSEMKRAAKDQLRGNWLWAVGLSLVGALVTYLLQDLQSFMETGHDRIYYIVKNYPYITDYELNWAADLSGIIIGTLSGLIFWGIAYTILNFRDRGEKPNIFAGIFSAFRGERFNSSFIALILVELYIFCWSLLFFVPGIIKSYSYAMTPYILEDMYQSGQKVSASEAITRSRNLMKGHKMDLFVLDLSFIGWVLVGILTCGIGLIWITPYIRQTRANFYRNLTDME